MNRIKFAVDTKSLRIAIVASLFNKTIVNNLIRGAEAALQEYGVDAKNIDLFQTPGAFELPMACKNVLNTGKYDAIVAVGCVIKGSTPHFDHVAHRCSEGIAKLNYEQDVPIAFGVLTTNTFEQAVERSWTGNLNKDVTMVAGETSVSESLETSSIQDKKNVEQNNNKGADAAIAALHMVGLLKKIHS